MSGKDKKGALQNGLVSVMAGPRQSVYSFAKETDFRASVRTGSA